MWYQTKFFRRGFAILLVLLILDLFWILFPLFSAVGALLNSVLYPFLFAMVLYYVLRPLVYRAEAYLPRTLSVFLVYGLIALVLAGLVIYVAPTIGQELEKMESFDTNQILTFDEKRSNLQVFGYVIPISPQISSGLARFFSELNTAIISYIIPFLTGTTKFLFSFVLFPFILFYFLRDDKKISAGIKGILTKTRSSGLIDVLDDIDKVLDHFIDGRVRVALASTIVLLIGLFGIGFENLWILGLFAFVCYTIPTVGPFLAAVPCILIGFSVDTTVGFEAIIITLICGILEGYVFTPMIMGPHLYIHPLTILVVLFASGVFFGLFGLLFGIPLYAAIKILWRYFRHLFRIRTRSFVTEEET